jgi:hypothetical protein
MKTYINAGYVKRRASIGKWASLLGLAVLAGGFILSLRDPRFFIVSFATLILGFLLSNVGIYYANRYARPDRPDAVLAQTLKGFDKRYALYQFLLPVSHVLREPGGLTIFALKPQEGEVVFEDGKWHHRQGWGRLLRWVGQEGLGKPDLEIEHDVQTIQDWLQKQGGDLEVPVRGVVVFTNPKAQLRLEDPPVDAMSSKQLKGWLRKAGKLPPLPKEEQDRLVELLDQALPTNFDATDEQ